MRKNGPGNTGFELKTHIDFKEMKFQETLPFTTTYNEIPFNRSIMLRNAADHFH